MPLYQNSVIYKLVHKNDQDNENIYIGSTTNFRGRKYQHKSDCNNIYSREYNRNVYQHIRENGGWNMWDIVAIENYPCNNKIELQIRERHHIETFKSKLNKMIPNRDKAEWYEDNKDENRKKRKEYRENNKEKISNCKKNHYEKNKEKILEKCKEYRKNNIEEYRKKKENNISLKKIIR